VKGSERTLQTLRFRGSPIGLDALVGVPQEDFSGLPTFAIENINLGTTHRVFVAHATQGATRLRITVAPNTAPGIYKGSAQVGDQMYPVEIKIEPYIHLSASPRQLVIQASAGQKLCEDLVLANTGNVPCTIGPTYAFGLYDVDGVENGIGKMFRQTQSSDRSRLDFLVDQLAEGHPGAVKLRIEEGAGTIAPGEVRALRLNFHMPTGLKPGHTYTGTLPLHNLRYYIEARPTEIVT